MGTTSCNVHYDFVQKVETQSRKHLIFGWVGILKGSFCSKLNHDLCTYHYSLKPTKGITSIVKHYPKEVVLTKKMIMLQIGTTDLNFKVSFTSNLYTRIVTYSDII